MGGGLVGERVEDGWMDGWSETLVIVCLMYFERREIWLPSPRSIPLEKEIELV